MTSTPHRRRVRVMLPTWLHAMAANRAVAAKVESGFDGLIAKLLRERLAKHGY